MTTANPILGEIRPAWLKKRLILNDALADTRKILSEEHLNTVCKSSICPNQNECFSKGQATFLLLGDICTRSCAFCSAKRGVAYPVDADEPRRISDAIGRLGIRYAVITSVTRDDLEDGGAGQFADTIRAIRRRSNSIKIEILVPDFRGNREAIKRVAQAAPDVFGHNIETVKRLYKSVRPGANYERSLELLRYVKEVMLGQLTKSSLMVGLGETEGEVLATMKDLKSSGCDILTIGQYLKPGQDNLPVSRYVTPQEFDRYKEMAVKLGFKAVFSGPFVRSSYRAEEIYDTLNPRRIYD